MRPNIDHNKSVRGDKSLGHSIGDIPLTRSHADIGWRAMARVPRYIARSTDLRKYGIGLGVGALFILLASIISPSDMSIAIVVSSLFLISPLGTPIRRAHTEAQVIIDELHFLERAVNESLMKVVGDPCNIWGQGLEGKHAHDRGDVWTSRNAVYAYPTKRLQVREQERGQYALIDPDREKYILMRLRLPRVCAGLRSSVGDVLTSYLADHMPNDRLIKWVVSWPSDGLTAEIWPMMADIEPVKYLPMPSVDYPRQLAASHYPSIVLGEDGYGESVLINLDEHSHLLIAGSTGSGKSSGTNLILSQLIFAPVDLILIDLKYGVELQHFADCPSVIRFARTHEEAFAAISFAREEMQKRLELIVKHKIKKFAELQKIMPDARRLVIVVDEVAELFSGGSKDKDARAIRDQAQSELDSLLALGRSGGVHVVAATQRPDADVISTRSRNNIMHRVSYALGTAASSQMVLGDGDDRAYTLLDASIKGRCIYKLAGAAPEDDTVCQTYYVGNDMLASIIALAEAGGATANGD